MPQIYNIGIRPKKSYIDLKLRRFQWDVVTGERGDMEVSQALYTRKNELMHMHRLLMSEIFAGSRKSKCGSEYLYKSTGTPAHADERIDLELRQIQKPGHSNIQSHWSSPYYIVCATCGSVSTCPNCAPYLRQKRRNLIKRWVQRKHSDSSFVTATLTGRHKYLDDLGKQISIHFKRWRLVMNRIHNRYYGIKKLFKEIDWVRSYEVTLGPNGFYPHYQLLFAGSPSDVEEAADWVLQSWVSLSDDRLKTAPEAHSLATGQLPRDSAVTVLDSLSTKQISNYISGDLSKVTKAVPFQLLLDSIKVDRRVSHGFASPSHYARAWQAYCYAIASRRVHYAKPGSGMKFTDRLRDEELDGLENSIFAEMDTESEVIRSIPMRLGDFLLAQSQGYTRLFDKQEFLHFLHGLCPEEITYDELRRWNIRDFTLEEGQVTEG